jgi:hypothetical protein
LPNAWFEVRIRGLSDDRKNGCLNYVAISVDRNVIIEVSVLSSA